MNASQEWYTTFFTGAALDAQRRMYPPELTQAQARFVVEQLAIEPGAEVLDVPCGNGRVALELAANGYRCCGVDLADDILDDARRAGADRGVEVQWERRDMRDLPWPKRFDGACCLGNSFAYLDDDGNARFLCAVAEALKPGGRFVLETGTVAEAVLPHLQPRDWHEFGDLLMLRESRYDAAAGRLQVVFSFVRGGKVESSTALFRVYTCRQVLQLLEQAGLGDTRMLGDMEGTPYEPGGRVVYFVCAKPA